MVKSLRFFVSAVCVLGLPVLALPGAAQQRFAPGAASKVEGSGGSGTDAEEPGFVAASGDASGGPGGESGSAGGEDQVAQTFPNMKATAYPGPTYAVQQNCQISGPGYNSGGAASFLSCLFQQINVFSAGQTEAISTYLQKYAVGDTFGLQQNLHVSGGISTGSDERVNLQSGHNFQTGGQATATVNPGGGGLGNTHPAITHNDGDPIFIDGGYLKEMDHPFTATMTGVNGTLPDAPYLNYWKTSGIAGPAGATTYPLTTAMCLTTVPLISTSLTHDRTLTSTQMCSLRKMADGRVHAMTVGLHSFSDGKNAESVNVTAVGAVANDRQSVTFTYSDYHDAGAVLAEGGLSSTPVCVDFDANRAAPYDGYGSCYRVIGSLTGTDLIYVFEGAGSIGQRLPRFGYEPESATGSFHLYRFAKVVKTNSGFPLEANIQLQPNAMPMPDGAPLAVSAYNLQSFGGASAEIVQHTGGDYLHNPAGYFGTTSGNGNANFGAFHFINYNSCAGYFICKGALYAPKPFWWEGPYEDLVTASVYPGDGRSLIWLQEPLGSGNKGSYSIVQQGSNREEVLGVRQGSNGSIVGGVVTTNAGFSGRGYVSRDALDRPFGIFTGGGSYQTVAGLAGNTGPAIGGGVTADGGTFSQNAATYLNSTGFGGKRWVDLSLSGNDERQAGRSGWQGGRTWCTGDLGDVTTANCVFTLRNDSNGEKGLLSASAKFGFVEKGESSASSVLDAGLIHPGPGQLSVVGSLALAADPTSELGAATKRYVDAHLGGDGSEEVVPSSATPVFSARARLSTIVLTRNVTGFTLAAGAPGQSKTIIFCEDATGGFGVAGAPATVRGFFSPGTRAGRCSTQSYIYSGALKAWMATSAGVIDQ